MNHLQEIQASASANFHEEILEEILATPEPRVLRGLVSHWPLVRSARQSSGELERYLRQRYQGAPVQAFVAGPGNNQGFGYDADLSKTNFEQIATELDWVLDRIAEHRDNDNPPTFYMGSTPVAYCLPGVEQENRLEFGEVEHSMRIWIGNRTIVPAHYDIPDGLACVCAGRRRFTLFPPEQLANLYVGPVDFTPAGQPVSLVDLLNPDLDRYPRFAEAMKHALVADLEPGDAIYSPSMWWHHVQGLESLNVLVNYWWRQCPAYMGTPSDALLSAILSIRDLPQDQRRAWRSIFDHYIFDAKDDSLAHIPEAIRGCLGSLDADGARKIRTLLRNNLNR